MADNTGEQVPFAGDWILNLDLQGNEIEASELEEVEIDGDALTFSRVVEQQGVTIDFSANIVDGKLEGTAETAAGEIEFTGTKRD